MPEERIEELEKKVQELEQVIQGFINLSQLDPQIKRNLFLLIGNNAEAADASYIEDNYDQFVNEGGSSSYQVPKDFDGLSFINGRLYGYYNP